MSDWWAGLAVIQQVLYYIAVPFTLVLVIQAVMSIIGLGGHDSDADADTDADIDTDGSLDADADVDADADMDMDHDMDMHAEAHGHVAEAAGFRFFTVRGLVAFFCILGWSGLAFYASGLAIWAVSLLSVICGLLAMFLIGFMFYMVKRLQSSGNIQYSNATGKTAQVYIPIPAKREGRGKVMVTVQERLVEAEAITDEQTKIKTGEQVTVVGNISNTLIVKRQE